MGHIVNTISTRIGWSDSWKDEFFLEFSYHCDYVHHFSRIRAMLVYSFFKKTPWDEFIIIFSHFDLFKIRRTIYLIVYAYFGKIILSGIGYEKYFDIFSKRLSKRKYNKTIRFNNHFILRMLLVKGLCVFLNKFFLMLDKRERKKRRNEIKNEHRLLNDVTPNRKEIVLYHEFASRKQCFENFDWVEKRSWICKKFRYPWDTNFNYYRKHVYNFRLFRSLLDFPPTKDGLLRPRLKYMRKLSSRIYLLYSMTKWASYCQFSETLFFINVYKKYLGWICDYLRYLISIIYISDKAVVSIERLTMKMLALCL